jgi:uncharacterized iron-regulated membrane protein
MGFLRSSLNSTSTMALFRTLLFWLHLTAGVLAGTIVLIMSITGVALTYEKQVLEWDDRRAWSAPPSTGTALLPPETLLARVVEAQPEAAPTTLTLRADPAAPATVSLEGAGALLVDPYRGTIIGPSASPLRAFFRAATNWHRWLAMEGPGRPVGKAVTGAANLAFLFIVVSGLYLWVPRVWSRLQFRNALWFRSGLHGKARDFNWHNAIGIWSAVPLAIVVAGAVPISYPWASNLVYLVVGEEPPRPAGPPRAQAGRTSEPAVAPDFTGIDAAYRSAIARVPEWRTIGVRVPTGAEGPVVIILDEGYGGQPQKRQTLTMSRATGAERWEALADQTTGRRLRSWLRFAHTGEYYGLPGQTVAGLVSAGAVMLVWTGIALACRRFLAWRARGRADVPTRQAA